MPMGVFYTILLLWVICALTPCVSAECPSVAVVVVASVFTTLAVVLIVLGIIGFLLWRRRKGKILKH